MMVFSCGVRLFSSFLGFPTDVPSQVGFWASEHWSLTQGTPLARPLPTDLAVAK